MRFSTIILALTLTGVALAAPPTPAPPSRPAPSDDVQPMGRGRLGFTALQISPALRRHFGAPADRGVLVDDVRPGSPAERAGLRVGDLVLTVDGDAVESAVDVLAAIGDRRRGEEVAIVVWRGARELTVQAKLADDPGPRRRFDTPFDPRTMPDARETRRALEETQRRLDEIERRLDQLDARRP